MEMANLEPIRFSNDYKKGYGDTRDMKPDIAASPGFKPPDPGEIRKEGRNYKLGIAVTVAGYFTFAFYILTIFSGIRFMQNGTAVFAYAMVALLAALVLASGVLFLLSLIVNIKQTRSAHRVSRGLLFTFIGIPPIVLCYLALFIKALTENH
jgi:hypothetical protein